MHLRQVVLGKAQVADWDIDSYFFKLFHVLLLLESVPNGGQPEGPPEGSLLQL